MEYDVGVIGLGVMGQNLALNMVDHGLRVAGYDTSSTKVREFQQRAPHDKIGAAFSLEDFISSLSVPRPHSTYCRKRIFHLLGDSRCGAPNKEQPSFNLSTQWPIEYHQKA